MPAINANVCAGTDGGAIVVDLQVEGHPVRPIRFRGTDKRRRAEVFASDVRFYFTLRGEDEFDAGDVICRVSQAFADHRPDDGDTIAIAAEIIGAARTQG